MIKRIGLHAFAAVALVISTCTPSALQVQARVANGVGLAGNRALPLLIESYQTEGLRIIEQSRAEGAPRPEAERRLAAHVVAWRPVWGDCGAETGQCAGGAWTAMRAAHDAWAEALEQQIAGRPLDLPAILAHAERLRVAYCALRTTVPEPARTHVPQIPGALCAATVSP